MVTSLDLCELIAPLLLLAEKEVGPVLERLNPEQRAAVMMALVAITLIGLFLIVLVMLGGNWARRLARHRPNKGDKSSLASGSNDAQLRQSLQSILPEAKTDDTIQFGKSSPDTKVGG